MADVPIFDKDNRLSDRVGGMGRRELMDIVDKLCGIVARQSYETGFRGGIRPDNISIGEDGSVSIGPGGRSEKDKWTAEELEFMSPEEFWNGSVGAGADVYAIGLLLYYCVSGGTLPFQPDKTALDASDRAETLRRRMSGEAVKAPKNAGKALGAIIEKAVAFKAEDRYKSVGDISNALKDCLKGLENVAAPDSEQIFNKSEGELSDVEKLMVGILGKAAEDAALAGEDLPAEAEPEVIPEDETPAQEAPAEASEPESEEVPQSEEAAEAAPEDAPAEPETVPEDTVNTPEAEEDTEPEPEPEPEEPAEEVPPAAPVKETPPRTTATPAVQYNTGKAKPVEKPRKKKNNRAPIVVALVLCAAIIIGAIVIKSISSGAPVATPAPTDAAAPTITPSAAPTPTATPTPTPSSAEPTYEIIMSDMSWTAAEKACEDKGGHLVVINDQAEFEKVTAMAAQKGARFVWLGCQRVEGGDFAWVNGEKVTFYKWADGEPSGTESNGTPENYVILWNTEKDLSGAWEYNDVGNDPVSIYPKGYSGKICYICEID